MKTVIFDFDGTIADSLLGVLAVYERAHNHNIPRTSDEVQGFRNKSILEISRTLNVPMHKMVWLAFFGRKEFEKHLDKVKLYHGMELLLRKLHDSGAKICILSTNRSGTIRKFLKLQKIDKMVDKIYGKAWIFNKAPKLRRLLSREVTEKTSVCLVGDEIIDVKAAKKAGIQSVAVSWGYTSREGLERTEPTAIVDSTDELYKVLNEVS